MNLRNLKDTELLVNTKKLVEQELEILILVLHHLREVERRKIFCDLNCSSLFDYCVKVLLYSEGKALRRIQAMRLLKELPEIEGKITSGELNLSNISKAQSCFRKVAKVKPMAACEKLEVLKKLENKSAREGEALLLEMLPDSAIPKDREKRISQDHIQITVVLTAEVKQKLEEVRSWLGPQGTAMDYNELISHMANLSCEALKIRKFGKKRVLNEVNSPSPSKMTSPPTLTKRCDKNIKSNFSGLNLEKATDGSNSNVSGSRVNEIQKEFVVNGSKIASKINIKHSRYISKETKHAVWLRDKGCCTRCGSAKNLNFDHIKPYALGGDSTLENLRLLCFNCNQRSSFKTFGINGYTKNAH